MDVLWMYRDSQTAPWKQISALTSMSVSTVSYPNLDIFGKQSQAVIPIFTGDPFASQKALQPNRGWESVGFYHATMQLKLSYRPDRASQLLFAIHFSASPCASSLSWTLSPFPDVRSPNAEPQKTSESELGWFPPRMPVTTSIFTFLWWEPSFATVLLRVIHSNPKKCNF